MGMFEMKMWKRATGVFKDQNSIWVANLSRTQIPTLQSSIIKATSHDECHIDYRNAQRVFSWIRTSPANFQPLILGISKRIEKTRSWVVALKGLVLMHGVFCCKLPKAHDIGRLPFDLSDFADGHLRISESCGFNNFIRCYYSFLDQRSALLTDRTKSVDIPIVHEIVKIQEWQALLDLLLQVRPRGENMKVTLIFEAMDCVIVEMYDVYSRICNGIARVVMKTGAAGKAEVSMALKVIQKAIQQNEEISTYFKFCYEYGIVNMIELPKVIQVSQDDIRNLERILEELSENVNGDQKLSKKTTDCDQGVMLMMDIHDEDQSSNYEYQNNSYESVLRTIITTDKWEVFEEDLYWNNQIFEYNTNPFLEPSDFLPLVAIDGPPRFNYDALPDLISL